MSKSSAYNQKKELKRRKTKKPDHFREPRKFLIKAFSVRLRDI